MKHVTSYFAATLFHWSRVNGTDSSAAQPETSPVYWLRKYSTAWKPSGGNLCTECAPTQKEPRRRPQTRTDPGEGQRRWRLVCCVYTLWWIIITNTFNLFNKVWTLYFSATLAHWARSTKNEALAAATNLTNVLSEKIQDCVKAERRREREVVRSPALWTFFFPQAYFEL